MKEFFKVKTTENSTNSKSNKKEASNSFDIWYRYNEGYSNAVRTVVHMKDL